LHPTARRHGHRNLRAVCCGDARRHGCGLRIPADVRIAGFDADTANPYGQIILTTVQQPIELITRRALDRLLEEGAGSAIDTESAPKALVA
jgi:DNA-binding LacI/PurR family transcriptional regulator